MTWLAVLLIGVAVADLAHSIRPVPIVNECTGAAVAVWVGLRPGSPSWPTSVALAVIAGLVVLWGQTVTRAFSRRPGGVRTGLRCWCSAAGRRLALLCSPWAGPAGGLLGELARRHGGACAARARRRAGPAADRGVPGAALDRQRRRPAGALRHGHRPTRPCTTPPRTRSSGSRAVACWVRWSAC